MVETVLRFVSLFWDLIDMAFVIGMFDASLFSFQIIRNKTKTKTPEDSSSVYSWK